MSTEQRRLEALHELVRITRVGGLVLVYVWALEQVEEDKLEEKKAENNLNTVNFNHDTDEKLAIDLKGNQNAIEQSIMKSNHVWNDKKYENLEDEKLDIVHDAKKGEAKEQKYIQVAAGRNIFQQQDLLVPWHLKKTSESSHTSTDHQTQENQTQEQVFHRFYHVFKRGELEQLCCQIPNVNIKDLYLDRGNWCIVLKKIEI